MTANTGPYRVFMHLIKHPVRPRVELAEVQYAQQARVLADWISCRPSRQLLFDLDDQFKERTQGILLPQERNQVMNLILDALFCGVGKSDDQPGHARSSIRWRESFGKPGLEVVS